MDTTGNSLAVVRAAIKAHGLQKLLAILHMEVIEAGEVEDLKRVLKRCL